jgi:hypothetical protein
MFGLPILRRKTPIRINEPKCKGAIYGCDPKEPPKLKSALRLAQMSSNHYSILVSSDWERIITWGSTPSYGRTGVVSISNKPQTAIINWKDYKPQSIIQVFSSGGVNNREFTIFRTESNQLYGTGYNSSYILNKTSTGLVSAYNLITEDVTNFCIANGQETNSKYWWMTGWCYMLYVKLDGKVYGLGPSNVGFGFSSTNQKDLIKHDGTTNYLGVSGASKVFCTNPGGLPKSFVLMQDGTVKACGYNTKGSLGVNSNNSIIYNFDTVKYDNGSSIVTLSGVVDVITTNFVLEGGANTSATDWSGGAGDTFSATYFLTNDGSVYTCGGNKFGQLVISLTKAENTTRTYAVKTSLTGVNMICTTAGGTSILAATSAYDVYTWGNNQWGQLGLGDQNDRISPTLVSSLPKSKIRMIHGGGMYGKINGAFLVVYEDGTLYGAGFNETYALGLSVPGTRTPDPGPITTFRLNEFFGSSPTQLTDSGRYPLILSGNLISGSDRILNATLTASKTFELGGTTFANQIIYVQQNFTLSGYGIQEGTIATTIDYTNNIVFLNKSLTADASFSNIRYDQRIRVYQADLCGYGTEMAQKIVTEDGTLYMSGWNQKLGTVYNFNYYANNENVSVPTFFDAKFS